MKKSVILGRVRWQWVILWFGMASSRVVAMDLPGSLQVGIDPMRPLYHLYRRTGWQYSTCVSVDLPHVILSTEYGRGHFFRDWASQGSFIKWGVHYSMLRPTKDDSRAFIGLVYAQSTFDHRVGTQQHSGGGSRQLVSAQWWEGVAGIRVRISQSWHMYGIVRYQCLLRCPDRADPAREVWGWGMYSGEQFGMSYYLVYHIPMHAPEKQRTNRSTARSRMRRLKKQ